MSKAQQTPLIDLLAGVPTDARILIVTDGGMSSHSIPVGRLAAEAAAELRRLSAEVEALRHNQRCAGLEGDETGAPCNTYKMLEARHAVEVEALRQELETERVRLAACGVVALADTPESASKARDMLPQYRSASCDDVARRVDECMNLRGYAEAMRKAAQAVIDRWDTPLWKNVPATAGYINALRAALAARPGGEG